MNSRIKIAAGIAALGITYGLMVITAPGSSPPVQRTPAPLPSLVSSGWYWLVCVPGKGEEVYYTDSGAQPPAQVFAYPHVEVPGSSLLSPTPIAFSCLSPVKAPR